MKVILALIPINLLTNWLLFLFILLYEPKTRCFLGNWKSGNKKYLFFVESHALPQRHAKFDKGSVLTCYSCLFANA